MAMIGKRLAKAATVFLILAVTVFPGHSVEWLPDSLMPQFYRIVFTPVRVGFVSREQRYFVLDRASGGFRPVSSSEFHDLFPQDRPAPGFDQAFSTSARAGIMHASDGTEFSEQGAYCAEGDDEHHSLRRGQAIVSDHVDPCNDVTAVEIVGRQLWLGTARTGEGAESAGEGVVVQSLDDGELLRKIPLPGMVRAIRLDPITKNVWVTTNDALFEVGKNFRVLASRYLREDFDDQTKRPEIFLSSAPKASNELAIEEDQLDVTDTQAFFKAAQAVSSETAERLSLYSINNGYFSSVNAADADSAFVPKDANSLVPFVLISARAGNRLAFAMLCALNDPRVGAFVQELGMDEQKAQSLIMGGKFMGATGQDAYALAYLAADCLRKYANLGLLPKEFASNRRDGLASREESDLQSLGRTQEPQRSVMVEEIVSSARALDEAGDTRGIELINRHFALSNGGASDARLYVRALQEFHYNDKIAPAALDGMGKLRTGEIYAGCGFFDMTSRAQALRSASLSIREQLAKNLGPAHYDARYAQAVLGALERAKEPSQEMSRSGLAAEAAKTCAQALRSQLADPAVKASFLRQHYPNLSESQKNLVKTFLE